MSEHHSKKNDDTTLEPAPPAEPSPTATPEEQTSSPDAGPLQPPVVESLAEQVQREAHTVVESSDPSDVVPNRPNIRPPTVQVAEAQSEPAPTEEPAP